jgi:hypothetical protein
LNDPATAQVIAKFRERLSAAESVEVIRALEAHAAVSYFGAWRNFPVHWPKSNLRRVPDHWRTVGSRHSPLSGGPRLAITPVHAILNYCFALLESESRLALVTLGLLWLTGSQGSRTSCQTMPLEHIHEPPTTHPSMTLHSLHG